MRVRGSKFRGVTLIELLVVCLITGVLASLLMVAISSARESARRTQCLNNLKQIGVGINSHLNQKGFFPRGENNYSAFVSLLPFLEQSTLYNSININKRNHTLIMDNDVNYTSFSTKVSIFLCPSEGAPPTVFGTINYGGNLGTGIGRYGRPDNGPFASSLLDPAIRDALIRDGLANTVAVSEFCLSRGNENRNPKRAVFQLGSFDKSQFEQIVNECGNVNVSSHTLSISIRGMSWAADGIGQTLYDHNNKINGNTCRCNGEIAGVWSAASEHSGGVNALFLDGHVQFVKETTSLPVWRSLGTMNGGEIIGDR